MTEQVLKRIQGLQGRYLRAAVGKGALLSLIYDSEVSEQVYNSNAIENSTLSLEETDKILQQIDLDRFISEREMFEAKNLARVVAYISGQAGRESLGTESLGLADHGMSAGDSAPVRHEPMRERPLTLETIRLLHKMLISNIRDNIAGRFRMDGEWVRVGSHIAADPAHITGLLQDMLIGFKASSHLSIIKRLAVFHLTFEHIHPFVDGNGRIGRVLNNYILLRENHVPITIQFMDRGQYYDAFQAFDKNGSTKIMEEMIGRALCNSYHKRLAYLDGKTIMGLGDYARAEKISHSNLLNKAKRQTIEAFWERGKWKIGV